MLHLAAVEFSTSTGFWAGVGLAAAIATALATAASTATAIWWRYQDRAEAEFSVRLIHRGTRNNYGSWVAAPEVDVMLQNIGDGTAHQVCVSGKHLARDPYVADGERSAGGNYLPVFPPLPVMRTGDAIKVVATAADFAVWGVATIEVTWWPPPTRKNWFVKSRKRIQSFALKDITPPPSDLPTEPG